MAGNSNTCCKVGAAIKEYDLDELVSRHDTFDDQLVARWKGENGGASQGYRPLTDWFNRRLLKREYDRSGLETTGTRVEREYEALTGDDLRSEEVRDTLRSKGVDIENVEQSFVSWSTMQRHLNNCLDAEKEPQRAQTNWERNSVEFAREQLKSKVDDALQSLDSKSKLEGADEAEVAISVEISCPECPLKIPFEEALERGYICGDHLTQSVAQE